MREKHERLRDAIEAGKPVSALYRGYWIRLLPRELEWKQEEAYLLAYRIPPPAQCPAETPEQTSCCERFPVDCLQCLVTSPGGGPVRAMKAAGV